MRYYIDLVGYILRDSWRASSKRSCGCACIHRTRWGRPLRWRRRGRSLARVLACSRRA